MHQSFEFIRDQHLPSDERAANMMAQKLRQGKVKLVGDVFIDTPSNETREIVEPPFDFDKYNGVKR